MAVTAIEMVVPQCGTGNSLPHQRDEKIVENNIQYGSSYHYPHRFDGIAGGTYQARKVICHSDKEHARKHNIHIFTCKVDGLGRGAKERKDWTHPDIACRDEKETKQEGKQHGVAQNLLGPAVVFATKDNTHSRRRSCSDK